MRSYLTSSSFILLALAQRSPFRQGRLANDGADCPASPTRAGNCVRPSGRYEQSGGHLLSLVSMAT
jgi:hypothetical protein